MPLFEVETSSHIMIACANDADAARAFAVTNYPTEEIIRVVHRPARRLGHLEEAAGHPGRFRSLPHRPRLSGQVGRRQAARREAVHAGHGHRPGGSPQGRRIEHVSRLVIPDSRLRWSLEASGSPWLQHASSLMGLAGRPTDRFRAPDRHHRLPSHPPLPNTEARPLRPGRGRIAIISRPPSGSCTIGERQEVRQYARGHR